MNAVASKAARAIIAHHSKSFALASKLLPPRVRNDAVVLYAYCRRVDDAVDDAPPAEQRAALEALRIELNVLYEGVAQSDPLLAALQTVIDECAIPRHCFDDLLDGMAMDVAAERYQTQAQLLLYCYRVAGTVGLMMCHVMGAKSSDALAHGKDLGIAMQLTNIARDVLEDWSRERLYLPEDLMTESGAPGLQLSLGRPFPRSAAPATARAIGTLLDWADGYYASGDRGLRYLSFRCAAAVYAARLVYSSIGTVLRRRNCDPFSGRAIVPKTRKLALAVRALIAMAFATALSACAHAPDPASAPVQAKPEAAVAPPQSAPASAETPAPAAAPGAVVEEPAATGEVVVDVIGLDSAEGLLLVALFRDPKGFPDKGAKAFGKRIAKARAGNARIVFRDVPPGPFAVTVHHDADKDMAMDTGLFGKPTEGYGFSRDASAPFGPPGFSDAKLTLAPRERKRVPIHMSY
jgi:phytoene synthase